MTAPAFSPEVVAGAAAMRYVRTVKYTLHTHPSGRGVCDSDGIVYGPVTKQEAIDWIDCQAFAAGLRARLPVSDELCDAITRSDDSTVKSSLDRAVRGFHAAINHITSGSAQHD